MLSFGGNFGIHRRNLLTTIRPLLAPWALCINSSSLFSSMLSWSCMGTNIFSSSSSEKLYLFIGMMPLTSFAPPPALLLFARVSNLLASNPIFVFAVVLSVSRYYRVFFALIYCNRQNIPIDSSPM